MLLCSLLNAYDLVVLVVLREDAVNAEELEVLLAECLELLATMLRTLKIFLDDGGGRGFVLPLGN